MMTLFAKHRLKFKALTPPGINFLKGFTLAELLIAVAVAALVISGVFMSLVNSMVLDSYNQNFTIAMNVARAKMEDKVFKERSNFTEGIVSSVNGPGNVLTLANDGLVGNWRLDVTEVIGSGENSELKSAGVAVCWKERGGRIIGDCENDPNAPGTLRWKAGLSGSPCSFETSIAKR